MNTPRTLSELCETTQARIRAGIQAHEAVAKQLQTPAVIHVDVQGVATVGSRDDGLIPVQPRTVQQSIDDIGRLIRISRGLFNDGISVPDVQGFVVGDRGVIPFAADVSGSGRDWSLPTKAQKRAHAIATADITRITQDDLDSLLAPLMENGLLVTSYQSTTSATEYRGPSGRVLAVSIGTHHFAHRDATRPGSFSLAQHAQRVGRITRITAERAQ